jgi:hypothetical protein
MSRDYLELTASRTVVCRTVYPHITSPGPMLSIDSLFARPTASSVVSSMRAVKREGGEYTWPSWMEPFLIVAGKGAKPGVCPCPDVFARSCVRFLLITCSFTCLLRGKYGLGLLCARNWFGCGPAGCFMGRLAGCLSCCVLLRAI